MPNVKGEPRGFRRIACITAPETAKPAPATTAESAWGSRIFQTMMSNLFEMVLPTRVKATSPSETSAAPRETLTISRKARRKMLPTIKSDFLPMYRVYSIGT
jgi:hypothetical protein